MTCCGSSSASALLALLPLLGCAGPRIHAEASQPGARYAVLPLVNYSGGEAPVRQIHDALEAALRARGLELVDDVDVEAFLARHRLRWVGGIDGPSAAAARQELNADGVVLGSVDLWTAGSSPKLGLTARVVLAGDSPDLYWMDSASRAGDESPGAFDLGLVEDPAELLRRLVGRLGDSLVRRIRGDGPRASASPADARFDPAASFRSPLLDLSNVRSVAVLPFRNETERRNAGDLLSLAFMRQLSAVPSFRVLDPGAVREQLLRFRIGIEQSVSLDEVRVLLGLLDADLVLTGVVHQFEDGVALGVPKVVFTVTMLERQNDEIVFESLSANTGRDGVFFFDVGVVATPGDLSSRMVRRVVDRIADPSRSTPARALR